eukprot:1436040-Pleurochrysis_carterae.AAC.1
MSAGPITCASRLATPHASRTSEPAGSGRRAPTAPAPRPTLPGEERQTSPHRGRTPGLGSGFDHGPLRRAGHAAERAAMPAALLARRSETVCWFCHLFRVSVFTRKQ